MHALLILCCLLPGWFPLLPTQEAVPTEAPDAEALLARASAACAAVHSASYSGRLEYRAHPDDEPTVIEAVVRWRSWDEPSTSDPGAEGSLDDFGTPLRADIRIDKRGGSTYAFKDGDLSLIDPAKLQHTFVPQAEGGVWWIKGNILGELVATPLLQPGLLEQFAGPAAVLTYEGVTQVGGVECHALSSSDPGDDVLKDIRRRYFIGIEDDLPRRFEQSLTKGGSRNSLSVELTDLAIQVELPDSDLELETPEGYEVVRIKRQPLPEPLAVGTQAPDWTLAGPDGEQHSLQDHRGQIVVMDFWGTWCVPCVRGMPGMQRLHEEFEGEGVAVLGISCNEPAQADPAGLMADRGFTYQLLLDGEGITRDYQLTGYPTVYVLDREGRVAFVEDGFYEGMDRVLRGVVQGALQQGTSDPPDR